MSSAMERLHDPSTNHYGRVEHVYSPREIGTIAQKVYDDEWTALGSVIAETMLETILDVGDDALSGRGWVEKTTVTNGIAEEVTSAVEVRLRRLFPPPSSLAPPSPPPKKYISLRPRSRECALSSFSQPPPVASIICFFSDCDESHLASTQKALHNVRSQPVGGFDRGPHSIPRELLTPLHALLRHSLNAIVGLDGTTTDAPFRYDGRDLSLLVRSAVTEAIESYCGIANANAPFFDLVGEMDRRASSRRRDLLAKHSRGCESVRDVLDDIESSRLTWLREVLGSRAVVNYEFGEVTTKAGNGHSHEKERTARRGRRFEILKGLFRDLEGVLMP